MCKCQNDEWAYSEGWDLLLYLIGSLNPPNIAHHVVGMWPPPTSSLQTEDTSGTISCVRIAVNDPRGGGGGGALGYWMATHCQTAVWSRSGERKNLGAVNSLKEKMGGGQLETENIKQYDFRGRWSVTLKNRGRSKKMVKGRHLWKTGAVEWQWVATFKEAVPPPPGKGPLTSQQRTTRIHENEMPQKRPLKVLFAHSRECLGGSAWRASLVVTVTSVTWPCREIQALGAFRKVTLRMRWAFDKKKHTHTKGTICLCGCHLRLVGGWLGKSWNMVVKGELREMAMVI